MICCMCSQVLVRLNHLGITMSPKSINKALDLIGEDYDLKLHEWKDSITSHMVQKKGSSGRKAEAGIKKGRT